MRFTVEQKGHKTLFSRSVKLDNVTVKSKACRPSLLSSKEGLKIVLVQSIRRLWKVIKLI
jgi:hypothetical protein